LRAGPAGALPSILAAAFLVAGPSAEEPAPPAPPAPKGADLDLLEETRAIAKRLEAVRGASLAPPPLAVRAPEELRAMTVDARIEALLPPARLAARGRAWADLALGDRDTPSRLVKILVADLDGATYDPAGRRLLVDPTRLAASDFVPSQGSDAASDMLLATGVRPDEPVIAHLLVHALEAQREGGQAAPPRTTDALLARAAWSEGEANLAAMLYLFRGMALGREVVDRSLDPGEVLHGALLPRGLSSLPQPERYLLDFAYRDGFVQARTRLQAGGWASVEEASGTRRTTRDALHLDRPPLPARAFPLTPAPPAEGFAEADVDSLGEIGVIVLVSQLTGKDNLGLQAGDGWAGDSLHRYESPADAGQGYTLWVTHWTSAEEAADFAYGITRGWKERAPEAVTAGGGAAPWTLTAPDRVVRVVTEGAIVRARVASPGVDRVLESQKKRPSETPRRPPKGSHK
jgi:hypothetical protein